MNGTRSREQISTAPAISQIFAVGVTVKISGVQKSEKLFFRDFSEIKIHRRGCFFFQVISSVRLILAFQQCRSLTCSNLFYFFFFGKSINSHHKYTSYFLEPRYSITRITNTLFYSVQKVSRVCTVCKHGSDNNSVQ